MMPDSTYAVHFDLSNRIKTSTRQVYSILGFLSDIGGFLGTIQLFMIVFMNFIYLPHLLEDYIAME